MDFKEKQVIYIDQDKYREYANCSLNYEGSYDFDVQYGLRYIYGYEPHIPLHLAFEIVDEKRFILAKIKFGI